MALLVPIKLMLLLIVAAKRQSGKLEKKCINVLGRKVSEDKLMLESPAFISKINKL